MTNQKYPLTIKRQDSLDILLRNKKTVERISQSVRKNAITYPDTKHLYDIVVLHHVNMFIDSCLIVLAKQIKVHSYKIEQDRVLDDFEKIQIYFEDDSYPLTKSITVMSLLGINTEGAKKFADSLSHNIPYLDKINELVITQKRYIYFPEYIVKFEDKEFLKNIFINFYEMRNLYNHYGLSNRFLAYPLNARGKSVIVCESIQSTFQNIFDFEKQKVVSKVSLFELSNKIFTNYIDKHGVQYKKDLETIYFYTPSGFFIHDLIVLLVNRYVNENMKTIIQERLETIIFPEFI